MVVEYTLGDWLAEFDSDLETELKVPGVPDKPDLIASIMFSLKLSHASKTIHTPISKLTGVEVAQYLNLLYTDKWERMLGYINDGFDIGETNKKLINETSSDNKTNTQTGNVINKESAFNTDDFINNDMQENELTQESDYGRNRERTESYHSYYTALQQMNNINSENLALIITKDIVNELCLKIY